MNENNHMKGPMFTAIIAALISGSIIHLFGLVNILHNYDDICMVPGGYGTGITSGRWFLAILGDFLGQLFGNYNLTVFNGLLFIFFIALSSGILVIVFDIQNRKYAALIGIIFISFPSATSTLFFKYTAVYYGFAILLAILATYVLTKWTYNVLARGGGIGSLCGAFFRYLSSLCAYYHRNPSYTFN